MVTTAVGYQRLIDRYDLPALPLTQAASVDSPVKGRTFQTDGATDQLLLVSCSSIRSWTATVACIAI